GISPLRLRPRRWTAEALSSSAAVVRTYPTALLSRFSRDRFRRPPTSPAPGRRLPSGRTDRRQSAHAVAALRGTATASRAPGDGIRAYESPFEACASPDVHDRAWNPETFER